MSLFRLDAAVTRSPASRDPVTAGLARAASRQQPLLPGALHGRGAVSDLELDVDPTEMRVDGVQRDGQFACDFAAGQVRREIRSTLSSLGLSSSTSNGGGWFLATGDEPGRTSRMSASSAACAV